MSNASGYVTQTGSLPLPGHRKTLTLLMLAYTLSMCDRMILSILFPDIKAEFGLSDTQLGLLGGISFALVRRQTLWDRSTLFLRDTFLPVASPV